MTSYPGGKSGAGVYQTIINQIRPHHRYIELFAGGGAILKLKRPAAVSIAMDLDRQTVERLRADISIPGLSVLCGSAMDWLEDNADQLGQEDFIYLDPPYLMSSRKYQRPLYRIEFGTPEQHKALLDLIKRLRCPIAISGYWSELYADELSGWRSITFDAMTRSGETAEEWLWMNYPPPLALHDYRYLGEDYREREKYAKRIRRWRGRLERMQPQERYAMLAALEDLRA